MPAKVLTFGQGFSADAQRPAIVGCRTTFDPTTVDPTLVNALANMYCRDPLVGGGVVGRPGCNTLGAQLGAGGLRTFQHLVQFTRQDGTEYTIGWCGGKMYTLNWGTRVWTEIVHGMAVSTSARIYSCVLADQIIFSDGVNTPFMWSGAAFTVLANCPALYGQPRIHYAKVFGIKAAKRNTIVWSEENDPTIGYEAGIYNNGWELVQTKAEGLHALFATNEALYYWRERSIGAIRGEVTPDFRSDGTREGVSEDIGTVSPGCVFSFGTDIYFPDADGRPWKITQTEGVVPLWADLQRDLDSFAIDRTKLPAATGAVWVLGTEAIFGLPRTGTKADVFLVVSVLTGKYQGYWEFRDATDTLSQAGVLATVKNALNVPTLVHGSLNGYAHDHGEATGTIWDDTIDATAANRIAHVFRSAPLGSSAKVDKVFDLARFVLRMPTALSANAGWLLQYLTTRANPGSILLVALTVPANVSAERQFVTGLGDSNGRWVMLDLRHGALTERLEVMTAEITAFIGGAEPALT